MNLIVTYIRQLFGEMKFYYRSRGQGPAAGAVPHCDRPTEQVTHSNRMRGGKGGTGTVPALYSCGYV